MSTDTNPTRTASRREQRLEAQRAKAAVDIESDRLLPLVLAWLGKRPASVLTAVPVRSFYAWTSRKQRLPGKYHAAVRAMIGEGA